LGAQRRRPDVKPRWKVLAEMLLGAAVVALALVAFGAAIDSWPTPDWHWAAAVACTLWGGDLVRSNWRRL
jgi:hypothetical protein